MTTIDSLLIFNPLTNFVSGCQNEDQLMKDSNFFLRPEDEMDFIPIIPLNESDGETGDGTDRTMSALVLGLLIASAKSSFDAQSSELKQDEFAACAVGADA